MANTKPTVIDCSKVNVTKEQKTVTRTKAQWATYFKNQVRICKNAVGTDHHWGQKALDSLQDRAKSEDFQLDNLPGPPA